MKAKRLYAAALISVTVAGPSTIASAADRDGNYAIRGPGAEQCSALVELAEQDDADLSRLSGWVDGYLSARNRLDDDTFDVSPVVESSPVMALVLRVCADNMEATIEAAVDGVVDFLDPARQQAQSEQREIEHEEARAVIREETMRQLQGELAERGLYDGGVDGVYGPGTRQGIIGFQQEAGLAQTGVPDPETILRLLLE